METEMLVFVGTYTDPILFGTGKILQGKGEGIYVYRLDHIIRRVWNSSARRPASPIRPTSRSMRRRDSCMPSTN